jgi:hypothetical protein
MAIRILSNETIEGTLTVNGAGSFTGNVLLGDGNITMDSNSSGQLQVNGTGYTGAIALDATAMYIYHNSSLRDLVIGTNETARLTIDGSSGNATFTGLVTGIAPTADLNFATKKYVDDNSGSGSVTGSGTADFLTMWSTGGLAIEDSPVKTATVNTLNRITVTNGERIIIDKPSSVTSGDPAFQVAQDGTAKVEFGWDDDGGGFAFVYNYAGDGIKLGSAGNNPMIEIITTVGAESVDLHKNIQFVDYGSGTYTGTLANALGVDSSGNVIEFTAASAYSGTQYTIPMFATTSTLGDSMITQNAGGTIATVGGELNTTTFKINGQQVLGGTTVALGSGANASGGSYSVGIGAYAGGSSTATYNTAVGGLSLGGNNGDSPSGSGNTAIGANALGAITSGGQNTAVGYRAGVAVTTGDKNIYIGDNAGYTSTTASKEIVIGDNTLGNGDNTITIGMSGQTVFYGGVNGIDLGSSAKRWGDIYGDGVLNVSGSNQSSFGGQVTIPAAPSANTDAASKIYVDNSVAAGGGAVSTADSLYDLIPNGAFTTTFAFTSSAGTYVKVMEGDDVITATGTYSVQVVVNDFAVGGTQYDEKYSGVMSWHATSTNDAGGEAVSEIVLHRAGHAANQGIIYLRTRETTSAETNLLQLEIMCNQTYSGASNVIFKFIRLI